MRDVTIEEVFTWKENIGRMALEAFGRKGAICNEKTYEQMKRGCIQKEPNPLFSNLGIKPLNSFTIYQDESVPDGVLRPVQ